MHTIIIQNVWLRYFDYDVYRYNSCVLCCCVVVIVNFTEWPFSMASPFVMYSCTNVVI